MSDSTSTGASAPSANSQSGDAAKSEASSASEASNSEQIQENLEELVTGSADDAEEGDDSEESSEESAEEVAQKEKEAKKAADALKKKLKLKVNGKEVEEEIDFNDDERLKRALQKEKAFDSASQELSQLKKQFAGVIEKLKGDQVLELLKEVGHNVDSLAEKHIEKLVEQAKKSPEQIAREQMEAELKTLKEEKEKITKEKEEKELESMRNQFATEIESEISSALDKADTILPKKNPKIIRAVAQNMLFAMQNGYTDVKVSDVIPLVEAEYRKDLKEIFDVLPEDTIEMLVGKNNLDRLRKKRIKSKKVQTQTANQLIKETGTSKPTEEQDSARKRSFKKFFSYIE
jgi:hypothetical protein